MFRNFRHPGSYPRKFVGIIPAFGYILYVIGTLSEMGFGCGQFLETFVSFGVFYRLFTIVYVGRFWVYCVTLEHFGYLTVFFERDLECHHQKLLRNIYAFLCILLVIFYSSCWNFWGPQCYVGKFVRFLPVFYQFIYFFQKEVHGVSTV